MATDLQTYPQSGSEISAVAQLPPDMMLLKMENESIMAVARTAPRDPMKIVAQLQQLIDAYPAAADEAIYSKPVGTVLEVTCGGCGIRYEVNKIEPDTCCPTCDSKQIGPTRKVKKFAEGLSVRAAESIRSIYGYTRLATTTEQLADGKVKLTGVLVDYGAGNVTSDERIVSPFYRARGGKMERTPEDRFLGVVVKAEKAKLRRDVILDNTPNIVKAMFRDACEKKLEQLMTPEEVEQKILPAFAKYGLTPDHLDKIIGHPHKLGWREEDRLALKKIYNALKNEETTVRELLEGLENKPEQKAEPPKSTSGVNVHDILSDTPKPTPQEEKPAHRPSPAPTQQTQPAPAPATETASTDAIELEIDLSDRIATAQSLTDVNAADAEIDKSPCTEQTKKALHEAAERKRSEIRGQRGGRNGK